MFTIKKKKHWTERADPLLFGGALVRYVTPACPEEVVMAIEDNGQGAGKLQPHKVVAVNTTIPEDYDPAVAVVICIDKTGHVWVDGPFVEQLPLALHMIQSAMNTAITFAKQALTDAQKAKSVIVPPGDFRV